MIYVIVIVWLAVVVADIVTTAIGVSRGLREATPWLKRILGEDDVALFGMTMSFLGTIVILAIVGLGEWRPWAGYALGGFAIGWRGRVVINNIRLIRGIK
jgi:hypothetical protein